MKLPKHTDYCTCFFDSKKKEVNFYDEIKDKPIKNLAVESKEEADHIMRIWQDSAPAGIICDIIHDI